MGTEALVGAVSAVATAVGGLGAVMLRSLKTNHKANGLHAEELRLLKDIATTLREDMTRREAIWRDLAGHLRDIGEGIAFLRGRSG